MINSNNIDYVLGIDPGSINLAYNLMNIKTKQIEKWGVIDIKDSTYEGMAIKMSNKLDSLDLLSDDSLHNIENKCEITKGTKKTKKRKEDDIYTLDYQNKKGKNIAIVIEFQMSKNNKTVHIVGQLFMYFTISKNKPNSMNVIKIVTYPAKEKLKYYKPMPGDLPLPERLDKIKKGHYYNKQLGIEHCRRVLVQNKEPQKTIDFFESCCKKDDLGDTCLMVCRYVQQYLQ